ncbi:MAG: hypothetical protein ACXAD7_06855 [Candidatus Kariarchaeaceae archaeon]|jgi:hypothetical protein
MSKKTESKPLKRDGMSIISKFMFTGLFFLMGFSIIGAGLKGAPATAPIVMTIGMLMVIIGIAPYTMPLMYKFLVPEDKSVLTP